MFYVLIITHKFESTGKVFLKGSCLLVCSSPLSFKIEDGAKMEQNSLCSRKLDQWNGKQDRNFRRLMVTQVFNLLRKIPVQLKLDFCVSLFSVLPQSPSFLLHRERGRDMILQTLTQIHNIYSIQLPPSLTEASRWLGGAGMCLL